MQLLAIETTYLSSYTDESTLGLVFSTHEARLNTLENYSCIEGTQKTPGYVLERFRITFKAKGKVQLHVDNLNEQKGMNLVKA